MKLTFTAHEIKSIVGIYVREKFGEDTMVLRTFMSEDGTIFGMDVEVPQLGSQPMPSGLNPNLMIPGATITHHMGEQAYKAAQNFGPQSKIQAIKEVRTITGSSLPGAKNFVEDVLQGTPYSSCFHQLER